MLIVEYLSLENMLKIRVFPFNDKEEFSYENKTEVIKIQEIKTNNMKINENEKFCPLNVSISSKFTICIQR